MRLIGTLILAGCAGMAGPMEVDDAGTAGGTAGSAAAGGSTAGGSAAGGSTAGGSSAGGATAGGATAGSSGGRAGGSGGAAGGSGTTAGGSGLAGGASATGLFAADRVTDWNPGILADEQLNLPLGADGLPVRTTVCATVMPGGNIQSAIDACPAGQVVQLAAGTFTVAATLNLSKGVVLRGSGSQGAPTGTTLSKTGGNTVIQIGDARDSICYGGTARNLTQDAPKGSTTLTVGSAASQFQPGDLALVDAADDAEVDQGDCPYFKRVSGRSVSQRVEVKSVDTANGRLVLTTPLHWTFRAAAPTSSQVTRVTRPVVRWAGIEKLKLEGGTNPGYNGEMAGGIDISNAAVSWVKDVQTDGSIGGMHVSMSGTYRVVVRDSWLHHSADYGFGHDCYGIVMRCGAADSLVENNIVRYMNKPIMFNASGGGNVIAYNYADNSWATPAAWQEVNIDTHCAFPHMELMEGNFAPHVGATTTHGNAGYLTFFRNFSSSQFASPAVVGSTAAQTGNIAAVQFPAGDVKMNVVGSVLGLAGWTTTYETYGSSAKAIYSLGAANDVSATTLFRHGNWDSVGQMVRWDPSNAVRTLPASLFRAQRPAWWPAGTPWPWVGSDLMPMVGTLPAKARSDALP